MGTFESFGILKANMQEYAANHGYVSRMW